MFTLPYPGQPTNGNALDASIVAANLQALAQAIQSFDGSQVTPGSVSAAAFATAINPNTVLKETTRPFVASGCTWQTVSNLQGTMTSGVVYINGIRVAVSGVAAYTFTASQDTYVDVDYNGNLYYVNVPNGATTGMTMTANAIRIAKIVTGATSITTVNQLPQQYTRGFTGFDPLGNRVYNTNPNARLLGISTAGSGSFVLSDTNLDYVSQFGTLTFQANGRQQVEVELYIPDIYWSATTFLDVALYDTTLASPIGGAAWGYLTGTATDHAWVVKGIYTPAAGTHTIQIWCKANAAGGTYNISTDRDGSSPLYIKASVVD